MLWTASRCGHTDSPADPAVHEAGRAQDAGRLSRFGEIFLEFFPNAGVYSRRSIDEAVQVVTSLTDIGQESSVLVTGSQHLVGGVLKYLQSKD